MMRVLVSICAAVMAISAVPVGAATLELEPSSEWRLREYEDKCRMIRKFGTGEDEVTLWIEKASAGRFVNMTAIGRPFRNPFGQRITLSVNQEEPLRRGFIRTTSSTGRSVISMFGISLISLKSPTDSETSRSDDEEKVDLKAGVIEGDAPLSPQILQQRYDALNAIELSGALVQKVSLETGGIAAMMAQLQQCVDTLAQRRSNFVAGEEPGGQGARTEGEREWAQMIQANYPPYLLREMAQGTVGVQVQVNREGRASYCQVTAYTGPAGLNDAACLSMMRFARFRPAQDENGSPIWGTYTTRITYRIN